MSHVQDILTVSEDHALDEKTEMTAVDANEQNRGAFLI